MLQKWCPVPIFDKKTPQKISTNALRICFQVFDDYLLLWRCLAKIVEHMKSDKSMEKMCLEYVWIIFLLCFVKD